MLLPKLDHECMDVYDTVLLLSYMFKTCILKSWGLSWPYVKWFLKNEISKD